MLRPVALLASLVLLTTVSPARADGGGDAEGAADPESTAAWVAFSKRFGEQLRTEQRGVDVVEELSIQGALMPDDVEPIAAAAYLSIQLADTPPERLARGTHLYALAERWVREGVKRQEAADPDAVKELRADPRLAYAIGRLRFADTTAPGAATQMGRLMAIARTLFDQAMRSTKTCEFDADAPKAWYFRSAVNLAQVLIQDQDPAQARAVIDEAVDRVGSFSGLSPIDRRFAQIARAEAFRALEEQGEAESIYRSVLEQHGDSPRGHLGLGRLLFETNRVDESIEHLRRAAETAKLSVGEEDTLSEALLTLASALLKTSTPRIDEAEAALREYQRVQRDHPDGLYVKGLIAFEREEYEEARNLFRRVHRLVPEDRPTLVKLAETLQVLGDSAGVEEARTKIREIEAAELGRRRQMTETVPDDPPGDEPDGE